MNEKTLQQVGSEAEAYYANHRLNTFNLLMRKQWALEEVRRDGPKGLHARITPKERRRIDQLALLEWGARSYDDLEAGKFAEDNAARLHDLAVLEAHIGGVAINVEQPFSVGEKIEIHTSE